MALPRQFPYLVHQQQIIISAASLQVRLLHFAVINTIRAKRIIKPTGAEAIIIQKYMEPELLLEVVKSFGFSVEFVEFEV